MLMLCWFYCISFAKFLYFALAPLFAVFSLFMLKRSLRDGRDGLKLTSFIVLFVCLLKVCLFDIRMLKKELLCTTSVDLSEIACNNRAFMAVELLGLVVLLLGSYGLLMAYKWSLRARMSQPKTPEQVNLRLWSNAALMMVCFMVVWQLAPWVGSLTVGAVPAIFALLPWQVLAVFNLGLLAVGFWKLESCHEKRRKDTVKKSFHANQPWSAKDTLWMTTFIYIFTLALSYAAHDVLSHASGG